VWFPYAILDPPPCLSSCWFLKLLFTFFQLPSFQLCSLSNLTKPCQHIWWVFLLSLWLFCDRMSQNQQGTKGKRNSNKGFWLGHFLGEIIVAITVQHTYKCLLCARPCTHMCSLNPQTTLGSKVVFLLFYFENQDSEKWRMLSKATQIVRDRDFVKTEVILVSKLAYFLFYPTVFSPEL
jgi:hypothetical protein